MASDTRSRWRRPLIGALVVVGVTASAIGLLQWTNNHHFDTPERLLPATLFKPRQDCDAECLADLQERVRAAAKRPEELLAQINSAAPRVDLSVLDLKPDSVIADLGAGTGALELFLLVRKVPFAKLYAVDIDKPSLDFLQFTLDQTKLPGIEKVTPVLCRPDDVSLPPQSIDRSIAWALAIGCHPLEPDLLYIRSLRRAMKPGAKHVQTMEGDTEPCTPARVIERFERCGFRLVSEIKLDRAPPEVNRLLVFEPNPAFDSHADGG